MESACYFVDKHQKFHKPCFVPEYSNSLRLVRSVVIIYLQSILCPSIRLIPSRECPYHNLGFSLVGFTSFHLASFKQASSLWHFQEVSTISKGLRFSFRRQPYQLPYLIFSVSTNTTTISEPCEHGLSSTTSSAAAITKFHDDTKDYTRVLC